YPPNLSAHDIGLKDLIDALYLLEKQPEIVLFTVSIADLSQVSVDLSPEVEASIPELVLAIQQYLESSS
ncbi:MAG: hydrogenase maturation protease, partial [Methanobacteriota archaeon]